MIRDNVEDVLSKLNGQIIVAATKYASIEAMKELLCCGITNFGENRVESLLQKEVLLSKENITWHFIGHLQRNKCSLIIKKIDYLHSLDSINLAKVIQKYRVKPLKCFLQVNISRDENKNGIPCDEVDNFLQEVKKFNKIEVVGLMTILKSGLTKEENLAYFRDLMKLKEENNLELTSMGMSSDYVEAVKAGATYIRLGSVLLGE